MAPFLEHINHYAYVIAFSIIVVGLIWGRFKAMHVFAVPVLLLIVTGFMDVKHIYDTAVNSSILTVMVLIALTGIIKKTIPFHRLIDLLGRSSNGVLLKSSLITASLSGFINNTPVVALLIPLLKSKSQENGWNVGRFLMPISFAAVAGGTITLIGTSTNLVLNGLMIENGVDEGFKFWDFLIPGLAVTGAVLLTSIILAPVVLKKSQHSSFNDGLTHRQYTTELKVIPSGTMDGKTVKSAGLRNLNDLFLAEIYRHGEFFSPVDPKMTLQANDTLFFTGDLDQVNELLDLFPKGLKTVEEKFQVNTRHDLLEVIVPNNSDLIGRPLKETNFRARFDAVIVGVQRGGRPQKGKIGRMKLLAGDLLLLSAGANFADRNEKETSLITVNQHKRTSTAPGREKYFLPGLLAIVGAAFLMNWTLLLSAGLMLLLGIACGITHAEKLKREFNLELYALLVLSVAFGSAIVEGKHAQFFIDQIVLPADATSGIVLLFLLTLILTNFMTNVSAVAIAFPIAYAMMKHYELDHLDVFLPVAFGASGSFLTPSSYQTHLMVMGPGNYSNRDFMKLGLPVLLVYSATAMWVLL